MARFAQLNTAAKVPSERCYARLSPLVVLAVSGEFLWVGCAIVCGGSTCLIAGLSIDLSFYQKNLRKGLFEEN